MNPAANFISRLAFSWRGDVTVLLVGALLPFAFAPYGAWPLAIILPAILFAVWLMSAPRRAAWRGWLFGLGYFGAGISWVFISIYYHGHVPLLLSILLTVLLIMYMAAYPALVGYLVCKLFPRGLSPHKARYKLLVMLPAVWVLVEWLRGWMFTGFPWLALGYSQIDSPLAAFAPLFGVYGVSWMVALLAALLVAMLLDERGRRYYLAAAVALSAAGFALKNIAWTEPVGEPVKVALLQGNIPQELKWHPDVRLPTIELYTEMTRRNWDVDLIVWPETAFPTFYDQADSYLDDLAQEARDNNTDLLLGILYREESGDYYNAMVTVGAEREFYFKDHLVPFTEYLPLKEALGGLVKFMQVPMSDFRRGGHDQKPLPVAGQKAGMSICFEDAFGEEVIRALPEATLLVNVSNDAWFDDSAAPPQHLQMARMRALESGRPLLRATNTGLTAVVEADGGLKSVAKQFEVEVLRDTIQPRSGSTPYVIVGNWLAVMLALLVAVIAVWRGRRGPA